MLTRNQHAVVLAVAMLTLPAGSEVNHLKAEGQAECRHASRTSSRCEVSRREVREGPGGQRVTGAVRPVAQIDPDARVVRLSNGECTTVGDVLDFIGERRQQADNTLRTRNCPEGRPALTPEMLIEELIVDIDLPVPGAHIAPGWMIVGRSAYLETGATMTYTHPPLDTPLGRRNCHDPGGPYPDGTITHAYTRAGHYDIAVTQHWTATWAVGDTTGQIGGLQTTTTLPQFEVRQVQAVRRR